MLTTPRVAARSMSPYLADDAGARPMPRWRMWAVFTTSAIVALMVYVGFHYMRGRYVVAGSSDWTLLAFGALLASIGIVGGIAQRQARRARA